VAYNYLGLVNDINRRLNEVELTQSNFASAIGYYAAAKDAVNFSLGKINQEQFQWPFNHNTQEETLVVNQTRYSFPSDIKTPDMSTFRIKRDDTLSNKTEKLRVMSYDEYLEREDEYDEETNDTPQYVFRTPDLAYGLFPTPDKAYTLVYEYYSIPPALSAYNDVPTVPEQFRHIVLEGAMYYMYQFRGDTQTAQLSYQVFLEGIKDMRALITNKYSYARSTVINNAY